MKEKNIREEVKSMRDNLRKKYSECARESKRKCLRNWKSIVGWNEDFCLMSSDIILS